MQLQPFFKTVRKRKDTEFFSRVLSHPFVTTAYFHDRESSITKWEA